MTAWLRLFRYYCAPGTEYLASDPVDVPGLNELLQGCKARASDVVFSEMRSNDQTADPFTILSPELCLMLVELLSRQDVANLRLASASFTQLPQLYFQHLVHNEMPWVWEVDALQSAEIDWHDLWCKLFAADGGSGMDEKQRKWESEKEMEANSNAFDETEQQGTKRSDLDYDKVWRPIWTKAKEAANAEIEAAKVDGRWQYRKDGELRGLRNRRRIHQDIDEILRRIAALTQEDRESVPACA